MRIKILQFIIVFIAISSCILSATNPKQAIALQNTSISKNTQEIQKVWESALTGVANRDIDAIMKTISKNYSKSIDGTVIDYDGFRTIAETNDADFFRNHLSCSADILDILRSSVTDNKAIVEFEYQFYAFNKNFMQWVTYKIIQEVTFAKENGNWKIITNGDKQVLF